MRKEDEMKTSIKGSGLNRLQHLVRRIVMVTNENQDRRQ